MRQISDNPFYVLELPVDCGVIDIETQGQKLLAMLQLELEAATSYRSPLGQHRRDAESVRAAMASLRDPNQRLRHELFARLLLETTEPMPETSGKTETAAPPTSESKLETPNDHLAPWPDGFVAFGWKHR